jgi:hypothetical protein
MRVAFVGQQTFFAACSLDRPVAGWEPTFLEFRRGADGERLRAELDDLAPDVVAVFRPDTVPAGLFAGLAAATLGFLTEPLPRTSAGPVHEDLQRRLFELSQVDPANFDRIISFDPLIAGSAAQAGLDVWRSVPLPVADRFYGPATAPLREARILFSGRGTEHREQMLAPAKARFDLLHVAYGTTDDELERFLREHDVGLNVHNEPYPSFENRVLIYLAAGLLVLSEPLSPRHGLTPGVDYLECAGPREIVAALELGTRVPGIHQPIREHGRRTAERFRASRLWPRVLEDLRVDLQAFGRRQPIRWNG